MILSHYHTVTDLGDNRLALYSFVTGRLHVTTEAVYKQLKDGNMENIDSSIIGELKCSRILLDSAEEDIVKSFESEKLRLIILPTGECNLRCIYCGLQKDGMGKISTRTMDHIVLFTEERLAEKHYKGIQVDWFGGEPTLQIPEIRNLTHRLLSVAERHALPYTSRIVTNGILLNEENTKILVEECKVSFVEVTIDGSAAYNDARRKNADGKGFYHKIIHNVEQLLCNFNNITFSIRCNVDRTNVDGIFPLLEDMQRRGIQNKCKFYIAMIHSWGSENGNLALPVEEFAELQYDVLEYMHSHGFNVTKDDILPFSPRKRDCTAVIKSAYVIDHHGLIFSCTETPYTGDITSVIGHVRKRGELLQRRVYDIPHEILSECIPCPVYPICGGGCRKRCLEHGHQECIPLKFNISKRVKFVLEINKFETKELI